MKIALPVADGKLAMHFGHCEKFIIAETEDGKIVEMSEHVPPPHEPGVLPAWLGELEVNAIIAGGMGQRAQQLFAAKGIKVTVGAPPEPVEKLINDFLAGTLQSGENVCDH